MNHIGTQTYETDRLILRPFKQSDADAIYRNWASDAEVTKFLTWPPHANVAVSQAFVDGCIMQYSNLSYYQWGIEIKRTRELIGCISVVHCSEELACMELGWAIGRKYWGNGYTPEAAAKVVAVLFEEVGTNCVYAQHDIANPNSGRVMQKIGMKYEGILRQASRNNRGIVDCARYSIIKDAYSAIKKQEVMKPVWHKLYEAARKVQNARTVSPFIDAGGVAAAILTKQGNIYVGVCIDTASTLGMCAERNAIANMITNGESQIDKVIAITPDGRVGAPCGACREYMMQLDKNSGDIEILLDLETLKTVRLKALMPEWWGTERFLSADAESVK